MKRAVLGLFLAVPAIVFAGEPAFVQPLRQDLVGKQFKLRVMVGATACAQTPGLDLATIRLVDTEVVGSSIQYYLRADRFMNMRTCDRSIGFIPLYGGQYITQDSMTSMHPAQGSMTVKQVEAKSDRIEIQLFDPGATGDAAYAKLKFMLPSGLPPNPLEKIEQIVNTVLELPRVDAINAARQAYDSATSEIQRNESDLASNLSAKQKVESGTRLLALYALQSTSAMQLNRVAFMPVPVPNTGVQIARVTKLLPEFRQAAVAEELAGASRAYDEARERAKLLCTSLPTGLVERRAELEAQEAAASVAKRSLATVETSSMRLTGLQPKAISPEAFEANCQTSIGELGATFPAKETAVKAAELAASVAELREAERRGRAVADKNRLAQLAEVDREYRGLKAQQATLDTRLLSALGGSDEYLLFGQYRNLLETMIGNRRQAQNLGSRGAGQEIERLASRVQKLSN